MTRSSDSDAAAVVLLHRLLAEEREKVAELLSESHKALAAQLEEQLASLRGPNGCDDTLIHDVTPRGGKFETFEMLTCSQIQEPAGDTISGNLREHFDMRPTSPNVEVVPKHAEGTLQLITDVPDENAEVGFDITASRQTADNMARSRGSQKVKRLREEAPVFTSWARRCVDSPIFESVFAGLIFSNAICMGLEQQYYGLDTGYKLDVAGMDRPAREEYPQAELMFSLFETFFGFVFTAEVVAKLAIFRCDFFRSLWNLYDGLIILCWVLQGLSVLEIPTSPFVMRLARLGRLLRLLRFAKTFQVFDVLHLLIRSMVACLSALMWSVLCLALVMMATTIFMIYMLQSTIHNESLPLEERLKLYRYFGTFTNGLFSLYELTMANWVPIARTVVENAGDGYMVFFIIYRTIVGFAVLKVVTAIFNAETFRVLQSDDDIMLLHKERQINIHARRMETLLLEGDESHDGELNLEEFRAVMEDPVVKRWLLAQDIEFRDIELAFHMIDKSGDGRISADELCRELARMKGVARSVDIVTIIHALGRVEILMDNINKGLAKTGATTEDAAPGQVLQNSVSKAFFKRATVMSS
eukprot:TRINITY_DN41628_c0_g2_i1.p1 TRINITY_DN41628_c0_g2~~TRINITY_DN41628_c0_g2_i1.p1  ORF type:complete len:585 (-),score=90.57 TRINITY_DN41628_c0_g2_i1:50-1804(-)